MVRKTLTVPPNDSPLKTFMVEKKKNEFQSSLMAQWVKGQILSLLWLQLLLWSKFDPWPRNFYMPRARPRKWTLREREGGPPFYCRCTRGSELTKLATSIIHRPFVPPPAQSYCSRPPPQLPSSNSQVLGGVGWELTPNPIGENILIENLFFPLSFLFFSFCLYP